MDETRVKELAAREKLREEYLTKGGYEETYERWLETRLIKIHEKKEEPVTPEGGNRYNQGKPRWSLVDFDALEDMVKVLEFGATKYSDHNWKKGLKTTEIVESLLRHIFAYLRGEDIDPESKLPHIGHILCNAMFLAYTQKYKPEFDTRFIDENKLNINENIKCY